MIVTLIVLAIVGLCVIYDNMRLIQKMKHDKEKDRKEAESWDSLNEILNDFPTYFTHTNSKRLN